MDPSLFAVRDEAIFPQLSACPVQSLYHSVTYLASHLGLYMQFDMLHNMSLPLLLAPSSGDWKADNVLCSWDLGFLFRAHIFLVRIFFSSCSLDVFIHKNACNRHLKVLLASNFFSSFVSQIQKEEKKSAGMETIKNEVVPWMQWPILSVTCLCIPNFKMHTLFSFVPNLFLICPWFVVVFSFSTN